MANSNVHNVIRHGRVETVGQTWGKNARIATSMYILILKKGLTKETLMKNMTAASLIHKTCVKNASVLAILAEAADDATKGTMLMQILMRLCNVN